MSGDVYISFGADTGELEAAMAKANAEVKALARELAQLAGEARKAGADADSEFGQRIAATAESLAAAKGQMRDLKEEMRDLENEARRGGEAQNVFDGIREAVSGALLPIRSMKSSLAEVAEVAAAAFAFDEMKEFVEHMAELGLETKKASEVLGVATQDVGGLSLVAKASGSSLEQLEMQYARFARNLAEGNSQARRAIASLGLSFADLRGQETSEQLNILADAFAKMPPGAERTAAAMEIFGRAGLNALPILAEGREGLAEWQRAAEETGIALKEDMVAAMEETHKASTILGAAIEGVGVAAFGNLHDAIDGAIAILTDLAEAISESIRDDGVWGAALGAVKWGFQELLQFIAETITGIRQLNAAGDDLGERLKIVFTSLGEQLKDIFHPGAVAEDVRRQEEALSAEAKKYEEERKKIDEDGQREFNKIWGNDAPAAVAHVTDAFGDAKRALDGLIGGSDSWAGKLEAVQDKIDQITQAMKDAAAAAAAVGSYPDAISRQYGGAGAGAGTPIGPTGDAAALVKNFEGYRSQAYWDVNHWRIGYGSDTMTDASGHKREVQEGDTTTREDAERDLQRRTAESAAKAAEQVGDAWGKLSDQARASLTSVAYNYGKLPADIAQAAQSGDNSAVANAILAHQGDNGGVNARRRAQEAANITLGQGAEDKADLEEKKNKILDEQRKAKEEREGGTPREKAELAAEEAKVKGLGDEIKAKQAIVKADQDELKAAQSIEEKRKAQVKLDQDTLALQKAQASAREADLSLGAARARATGDPKAEHDASTALAQAKMDEAKRLYGADSAEYKRAEAEKEAADRRFNEESNRLARQRVEEEAKAARDAAAEQRKALDDALSHKRISSSQWLSQTQAVNEQEKSQLQALYAQELALANQTEEQKVAIKNKEADALRQINQKEADDARKAADQTQSEYESAIGGIASSFTSAFKGMISGHETFRQAMVKAMEGLATKFVDMVEKMVVKWIAGELAKTTATTTGEAARSAAQAAGNASSIGAVIMNALKAVTAGAGQTAAGVSGFMAPITGPAAPAIGMAAGATVLADAGAMVSSADIGMWKVPTDQLAMIHQNELIMPAAQAGAFRDMLTGAANGTGGGGAVKAVHVHPQMNIKVGAMDASGFGGFLRNNQRELMKAMDGAVRQGAHLGLRGAR
jgi:GH24 family phage-related lysozyme (muramidase)